MKNKQFFILILLLVIGFASISATLVINGNTKIAANLDDFNVVFIEGFLNGETNENIVISGDKKTLTFTTNTLTNINDTARVDYKVKNTSTQYDGDVTINCTNAANNYVTITSSFDANTLPLTDSVNMQAQEEKSGYINAELTKAVPEDQEVKITCKIEVAATSRTNYAYSLSFDSNGGTDVADKIVEYNSNYGELSEPTKEGYTFIGWFNEDDVKVDEKTILDTKGNRKLIAKWAQAAYPVEIRKVYKDKTETETINIPYGEYVDTLITVGEEYYISDIKCTNGYSVDNFNKDDIIYNEQTIRINNNRIAKESTCTITVNKGIFAYSYKGDEQEFVVPLDGNYKVELWGSSGADFESGGKGGAGAYTSGNIHLKKGTSLYLYVGEAGTNKRASVAYGALNFNGSSGGNFGCYAYHSGNTCYNYYGGSATDIRLKNGMWNDFSSLKSRIMVAAGGASSNQNEIGAAAGGLIGYSGQIATGGTQKSSGTNRPGGFGYGGVPLYDGDTCANNVVQGAGSGYYGGGTYSATGGGTGMTSSGGGSSFISGHNGCDAIAESSTSSNIIHTGQPNHYSGYVFTNTVMIDGAGYKWTNVKGAYTGMPSHDSKSTMTGNSGNGYAKITYLG